VELFGFDIFEKSTSLLSMTTVLSTHIVDFLPYCPEGVLPKILKLLPLLTVTPLIINNAGRSDSMH
jgi:hypothetical protein